MKLNGSFAWCGDLPFELLQRVQVGERFRERCWVVPLQEEMSGNIDSCRPSDPDIDPVPSIEVVDVIWFLCHGGSG